jgi:hypothetical protein
MDTTIDIEKLSEKFNDVFCNIDRSKWGYCHKRSVGNFIFHLNKIKGRSEKKEIFELIDNYLNVIKQEGTNADLDFSEYLFKNYLNHISNKFQYRLGFLVIFPVKAMLTLIPLLVIVYLFARTSQFTLYAFFILLSFYLIWLSIKLLQRKVYGFGY